MKTAEELKYIRWQCHRGMLELDILLQKFFDQQFIKLSASEQQLFVHLLEYPDQQLFLWLMGREQPSDPPIANLVQRIRDNK